MKFVFSHWLAICSATDQPRPQAFPSPPICLPVAIPKGPVTPINLSCNLQRNSTLKRCEFVTNVSYGKNILANCDGNLYLPILHLPRVELHCKLQEKLHRVTGP